MADPLVSIVVPTFNRARLLGEALDGIAAQTFRDYEIIVVDDGSTDETPRIIAARPEPIRRLWQPNQGPASARNYGLSEARGTLVAFLDSDDVWMPGYLQACVALMNRRPELALAYCDFTCIDGDGSAVNGHRKRQHGGDVLERLFASVFIHTSCVTARKQQLLDAGGFDPALRTNEDYDLWLRLALRHPFGLIPQPLCKRRTHRASLSRNGRDSSLVVKAHLLERFYRQHAGQRIASAVARRRLAKVHYSAGKALLRARRFVQARQMLQRSLRYQPAKLKAWALYLLSKALATVRPGDSGSSRPHRAEGMPLPTPGSNP